MQLYIDTSKSDKILITINGESFTTDAHKDRSQKLLPFIVANLEKRGKQIKDISEIKIHTGPGSFTGLRVGLTVANALSYALKIPVNGKKIWQGEKVNLKYD